MYSEISQKSKTASELPEIVKGCNPLKKSKITKDEYSKLYPTGSNPRKFYGIAKIDKLSYNDTIDQLPLRPTTFYNGTASYHLNILENYYPRSASHGPQLKIPKNLFKNLKTLFLWILIQS